MKRGSSILAALLLAPCLFSPVSAQVNSNLAGAIAQLLDHPVIAATAAKGTDRSSGGDDGRH